MYTHVHPSCVWHVYGMLFLTPEVHPLHVYTCYTHVRPSPPLSPLARRLSPSQARAALFEATGLPIVKDSSANKCGAICSPAEISLRPPDGPIDGPMECPLIDP